MTKEEGTVRTQRNHAHSDTERKAASHTPLDESNFIRNKLYGSGQSAFDRYRALVFNRFTWPKLIRYELLVTFVGPLAGALGLALRKKLYPYLFRAAGKGVNFGRGITLHHADQITLGDEVFLDRNSVLDARGAGDEGIVIGDRVIVNRGAAIQAKIGHIRIGNDCSIGAFADVIAQGPIILGNNVSVAGKAIIAGGRYVVEEDAEAPGAKSRFSRGEIRIGDNARIGMGAIVQDGVTIGENAIVAPGAVVYEDVAADTVVWGNPARPVRNRRVPKNGGRTQAALTTPLRPVPSAAGGDSQIRKRVCAYLEQDLFIELGTEGIGPGDSLLDAGVMDSLALVRLLQWIEAEFNVDLDFTTLDPGDIDSVDKIVARIGERKQ